MNRKIAILEYLPQYVKEYKEIKKIMEVANPEIESVVGEIERLFENQFIDSTDEVGIKRFESMMGINGSSEYELEDRQARVIARWNEDIPYTYIALKRQMDRLCGKDGYVMNLFYNEYRLEIYIRIVAKEMFNDVVELLKRVTPCNIDTRVYILHNKHETFEPFKRREVGKFTHRELKEEFIARNYYLYRNIEHEVSRFAELKVKTAGEVRRKGAWYIG